MNDVGNRTALRTLITEQLSLWPEHAGYLRISFARRSPSLLDISEEVAALVLRLAKHSSRGLKGFCEDYRFLCTEVVLPEELHFRRYGRYRLSSFADANEEWYSSDEKMGRYMAGLLVSNVLWEPHAHTVEHFVKRYLPAISIGADHLEIGPGHGLLLQFAARQPTLRSVAGWDISPMSIEQTKAALAALELDRPVTLRQQDLFVPDRNAMGSFDSITLGEILEHLEDPLSALRSVRELLRPNGQVWINVPVNSPAPDHIYLLRTPEEACALVEAGGFAVVDSAFFPMTGLSLADARRRAASISCVIVGRRQ